jgi:hypothetical protein
MAGIRTSGTRTVAPRSGSVTGNSTGTNISQQDTGTVIINAPSQTSIVSPKTVINSSLTNVLGRVETLSNTGTATIVLINTNQNVGSVVNTIGQDSGVPADQSLFSTTAQRKLASAYFSGGIGIEKDLAVGGFIYGRIAAANTATTSSNISVLKTNEDATFYPLFTDQAGIIQQGAQIYVDNTDQLGGPPGLIYNPFRGKLTIERARVSATDNSNSIDSGALTVDGGVGIAKNVIIGGNVIPASTTTSVGDNTDPWSNAYLNNIYTRFLGNGFGDITMSPNNGIENPSTGNGGIVDIFGELRVRGQNPIGTAPIVTNTLYVTMDGNDTNDGRAMDASRACRTIGGAINSPYYQSGTQIRVGAGRYLENNPLVMKPYTSVQGSDIRTTFIEPINKTQDLFHVNSGVLLTQMNFLNGRSGRLDGAYDERFNRGAYSAAFPPLTGDDKIDLFQSPYIQNCTNQSGPWLRDGTMFRPNQTVQIPSAVAIGSWEANTASIIVSVQSGSIAIGQSINAGQQNPGFFNARTLLLANKPFVQSQVVAWVDATFNSGNFVYNKIKCERDTGLIVHAIAQDMLQESTGDSVFAGIQYWNQGTYTGAIPSEITETIQAITFLKGQAVTVATNAGGSTQGNIVGTKFDIVLNILTNGTAGVTDIVDYSGLASTNMNVTDAYDALIANIDSLANDVINYITINYPSLDYIETKCRRDVGYIIQSVAYDLLHGGNVQSIKSGVYYYEYSNTSTLASSNEIPATTAAYNFIKGIVSSIVTRQLIVSTYQTAVPQVLLTNAGTVHEVEVLQNNIDIITNIIRNGPGEAATKVPIGLIQSESVGILNAYNLLIANIPFIQAETIAFIDQTINHFEYNRQLCYRDTAILLENMAYDMAFGGNEKSVESGKAYYRGVTSVIAGQETQTIGAIDYLKELCQKIVQNQVCPVLVPPLNIPIASQVINTDLTGGAITIPTIGRLFNITTGIIQNGPDSAPSISNSSGPDSAFVSAEVLLQANRKFIQENVINHINYNLCYPPKALPYNQIKCRRDTGVIIDGIAIDLLFPTSSNSQSTFAGLQYFNQSAYTGAIKQQLNPTIDAITYLRDLSVKVVQNITTATDALLGVYRYTNGVQTTASNYATSVEVAKIKTEFGNILSILKGRIDGWTDLIEPNGGTVSQLPSVQNTVDLLLQNVNYMAEEVVAYVNATNDGFTYSTSTCKRDIGFIIQSISFDLLYGGNRQSIQSGLSYYVSASETSVIQDQSTATVDAFTFLGSLASTLIQGLPYQPLQTRVKPVLTLPSGDIADASVVVEIVSTITNIIANGPVAAAPLAPVSMTASASTATRHAFNIITANRKFMVEETIKYLDQTYNADSFNYDQTLCYRDTGLIIDAVSQDILLGGNQKSIESGLAYWNQGYNYVADQITTTTSAINYARDISLQIIANQPVTPVTGTVATQVINPFYQYGGDYMPQESVARNFHIITNIIENGKDATPPIYAGSGLYSLTGIHPDNIKIASKITSLDEISTGTFIVGLDTLTVGASNDATLYFGDTLIYPLQDVEVDKLSLELTGDANTWNQRKVDAIGAIGGALIDGAVISDRSPIQSFVFDAYTQLNQGGIGVKVTNNGYAQLVSVFTIFCSIGVICDNGGIASITNSNCNFGDISLLAKGYGRRDFSGTVFNPAYRAYPFSPNVPGSPYLDQFYPTGYWPNNGGRVEIFVPDDGNRPHIGQVMEIIPPLGHVNEQGFSGFLNTQPSTSTFTTGTIILTGLSTTDVFIGNTVFIRDQFGRQYDDNGMWYATTGTIVTNVDYNSITLNKALTSGGGDVTNPTYFTVYFCGNSYYTVQTSSVAVGPYAPNTNILSANSDPYYEGPATSQVAAHINAIGHLKNIVDQVIANIAVVPTTGNNEPQTISPNVTGGINAQAFIDLRFEYMIDIVGAPNIAAAQQVVPQSQITKVGTIPTGAGSAVTLIEDNINFIAEEVAVYVDVNLLSGIGSYNKSKCVRDVKLILQQLIYDLQTGGNYNSVYSGLSYWSRLGTYHVVELGEAVNRPDLFPDGSTANFYQRSYISASGYLFEYVGAGTNYGALPQRGVADPVQSKETVQLNSGKVFFTSTDQNGDFRIGPGLVISQATGVLSGRTFVQSLYANMTPFILAIT